MPAYDRFHAAVRHALVKDGWTITDDPLTIRVGDRKLFVDLGAEQVLGAEKGPRKIAVEIKTFAGPSGLTDLHEALGQYVLYREVLAEREPERELYLAVSTDTLDGLFREEIGLLVLRRQVLRLIGFDPEAEEITRWMT